MSTSSDPRARAADVRVTETELIVRFVDGRTLTVPLSWYPRLKGASAEARSRWQLLGGGIGIHWPDVDEDLSVEALLAGRKARGAA